MPFVDDVDDVVGFYDNKEEDVSLIFCTDCCQTRNIWGDGAVTKQDCELIDKALVCDGCGRVLYKPVKLVK